MALVFVQTIMYSRLYTTSKRNNKTLSFPLVLLTLRLPISTEAMADWSITDEYKPTFRYEKSDKTRNIVQCAHADCSFRVYAAMNKDHNMVKVATVNSNHICAGAVMQPRSTANGQAWLQRILPATFRVVRKNAPSQITDALSFTIRCRLLTQCLPSASLQKSVRSPSDCSPHSR